MRSKSCESQLAEACLVAKTVCGDLVLRLRLRIPSRSDLVLSLVLQSVAENKSLVETVAVQNLVLQSAAKTVPKSHSLQFVPSLHNQDSARKLEVQTVEECWRLHLTLEG